MPETTTGWRDDDAAPDGEDVAARAARLGITVERVLEEYRRIAFSDISRIVEWDDEGEVKAKASSRLDPDDAPAIAEIVASASSSKIYRVKLHDKKPVLDALARHLGMLPPPPPSLRRATDAEDASASEMDPREAVVCEVDRIAAEEAAGSGDPQPAA
jgi:hypothetical protein